MKYYVYVVQCKENKYWVGFTSREVDEYFDVMLEGKGPNFVRNNLPLKIVQISQFTDIDEAKLDNVKVYEILSKILGKENVQMDLKRYKEVKEISKKFSKNSSFDADLISSIDNGGFKGDSIFEGSNRLGNFIFSEESSNGTISSIKNEYSKFKEQDKLDSLDPHEKNKFVAYRLLCMKNARYIGITQNIKETYYLHKKGEIGSFTKMYRPKKLEVIVHCKDEMEAKIAQIDLLDEFRFKYGYQYKIYTEFIDSKKDLRTVYEDIIPPSTTSQLFDNTPSGPEIKYWVYVLLCEESKYYVGFTSNLRKRFKNHNSSRGGSNYTFEYTPICVLHIEGHKNAKSAKNAERDWTLDLKKLNGRDNVYGYWSKSYDSESSVYYAHELLENWTVKNIKAFDL